jgi:hypothetical protein
MFYPSSYRKMVFSLQNTDGRGSLLGKNIANLRLLGKYRRQFELISSPKSITAVSSKQINT